MNNMKCLVEKKSGLGGKSTGSGWFIGAGPSVMNMNRSPDLILLDSAGAAAAETAYSGRQEKNLSRIDRRSTPKLKRTHHHDKGHWVPCSVSEEDMDGELC
ncbi:hypothetical protein LB507_006452 [Fusarium sp. FIESC RH6]|nr:hypothetical protein LB507_006452 [Fusarium sp. FIESC RH6]